MLSLGVFQFEVAMGLTGGGPPSTELVVISRRLDGPATGGASRWFCQGLEQRGGVR